MNYDLIQIGSHIGNTINDNIFNKINSNYFAIFVEPIKEHYVSLVKNYNSKYPNNNFIFLNKACSDVSKKITLYKPILKNGLPLYTDQLTSVIRNHVKNHNIITELEEVVVEAISLTDIVNEYKITSINLLSIDAEGHDYEILKGMNFNKVKPKNLIFEHKHIDGTNKSFGFKYFDIINYLTSYNYDIIRQIDDNTHMKLKE